MRTDEKIINEEALNRLNYLQLMPEVSTAFKDGQLMQSEHGGLLYYVSPELKETIKKIEKEKNIKVYHVVKGAYEFPDGTKFDMSSLLCVSDYPEEWQMDHSDMKNGIVFSYTLNETDPQLSEFGSIGVEPINGGLIRNSYGFDYNTLYKGSSKYYLQRAISDFWETEEYDWEAEEYEDTDDFEL